MKSHFFLLVFGLLIVGCSSDDDSGSGDNSPSGNYFPSSLDDSWTYAVENTSTTNPEANFNETDVVTINSVTDNSFTIEVNDGTTPANGTMNTIFGTGTFTKSNTSLEYNGDLAFLSDIDIIPDADIALTDFVLYDTNATANTQLDTSGDSFTQDIDLNGETVPMTITYQISNTHITNLSSLTVNNKTYTNVIQAEIKVNLSISAVINFGFPITQPILDPQDVLIINHYYAENVGLIKADSDQSFEINAAFVTLLNTLGATVDFPTNGSSVNIQELDGYTLSED